MTQRIVVAVDGGPASDAALDWVIARAATAPLSLEITTVVDTNSAFYGRTVRRYQAVSEQVLAEAAERVEQAVPSLEPTTKLRRGNPAHALIAASREADILVLGTNKTGSIAGVVHGTLALRVAGRARCATVVIPADWSPRRSGVVAGWVDDGTAEVAVDFAADEAERLGQELTIVHAWHVPPRLGMDLNSSDPDFDEIAARGRRDLSAVAERVRRQHPGLVVKERLEAGSAPLALVSEAGRAALLVVGSHGRGALGGLILGSVSHDALMNMPAPVAVVPNRGEPIEVLPEILEEDYL